MKSFITQKKTILALFVLCAAISGRAQSCSELDDSAIIGIYNQVNAFDIESALLAQSRGDSSELRNLSQEVAEHHRDVRLTAAELARTMGIVETIPASRETDMLAHDRAMVELSNKSGVEFDRAYLQHEIAFHEATINAIKTVLLPGARDPRLKKHFESMLPHFEHHLKATISLAQKLGYHS